MTSKENGQSVRRMFASIAGRYDLANHFLSGGLDFLWRRRAARLVQAWKPALILDLATGSGDLALRIAKNCPAITIVGADFCQPMLALARRKGMQNLVVADALALPFEDGIFDVVTVAFGLRNMASWPDALAQMRRVLRPGGRLLILDFAMPSAPVQWIYKPYLRYLLPRLAACLTAEKAAYEYLGESIENFPSRDAMSVLLEAAGFTEPKWEALSGGIVCLYTATRR